MRPSSITVLAVATLLFSANAAFADSYLPIADDTVPVCGSGKSEECESKTVEQCLKWVIVEIQLGTTTATSRECQQKETTTTKKYYTT
jgi:hypothetical protein